MNKIVCIKHCMCDQPRNTVCVTNTETLCDQYRNTVCVTSPESLYV